MIRTAYAIGQDVQQTASTLKEQLTDIAPSLILFFASSCYAPDELSSAIHDAFPNSQTIGCSTSGEIVSGQMLKDSVVAMAFDKQTIEDFEISIVSSVSEKANVKCALEKLGNHFGSPVSELAPNKYVGLVLVDGLRFAEEKLMETIGDAANLRFIGGSAGDDLKFKITYVMANGLAYTDAAVLALLKPACKFDILKTQSFTVKPVELVATKVNEAERQVLEFNNEPATVAYAKAIGCPLDELASQFMRHPLGLIAGDEPYVRSPQQVKDNSVIFYCQVLEGSTLTLLESQEIVAETKSALAEKIDEFGKPEGIINFHCILRTLELEAKNQTKEYGEIFSQTPTIGFSTYGEQLEGHINQTSTLLIFGK
jgi:hypothetical protein